MRYFSLGCVSLTLVAILALAGCDNKPPAKPNADAHDHDHGELGPHEGHILELGNEEYHAEWLHDDATGKVTIYILDSEMKKEVPIEAETISITTKIKDAETVYPLEAVNASSGDMPTASQFEITDKPLVETLKTVGEGVSARLDVDIKGKTYTAKFEAHEEHDGHKH